MPQHMQALALAQTTRLAAAELRREIKAGTLTVAQALEDPRAGSLTVERLLTAQLRWGTARALKTLQLVPVTPNRRVRDLTGRQATALARLLAGYARDCNPFPEATA